MLLPPASNSLVHPIPSIYTLIIIISGLHHYECVAPLVANSRQSGPFWARSTASVHDSPWESRSFCTVFIQVIRGRPGSLFQYTEGEEVKICFASTLSSIRAICPNGVRRRAWIISVCRSWLVWRRAFVGDEVMSFDAEKRTDSPLMEGIDPASSLVIAQHSDPYRKIGNIQVL